ncbi:MAG: hypothetical protein GY847_14985 [Proteobacteria bacterium]|nr:hypothetical protein [Pseudomonadota bacterium]
MNRGARRQPIFLDDDHASWMLDCFGNMSDHYEIEVHGYSLMPNHFHAILRSRHGNLSQAMRHFSASFTQGLNSMHTWDGPVFKGRFKSQLVRDETMLPYILAYIHLNPLRAHLITRLDAKISWTSHRAYLGRDLNLNMWLDKSYFLDLFEDGAALHAYIMQLHRGSIAWPDQISLDTGFFKRTEVVAKRHGQYKFETRLIPPKKLLAHVSEITETSIRKILTARRGPNANPARRFAVYAFRQGTQLTQAQIGKQLNMTANQVANVLRCFRPNSNSMTKWTSMLYKITHK